MANDSDHTTYAAAGVHLELGDTASQILYTAAKRTWAQRQDRLGEVIIPHDDFSGVRYVAVGALPADVVMGIGFDGIGTKIDIAERMGTWHTLAFDLFAMVCDDAVVQGAEPVLLGTVLDVRTLGTVTASYVDCVRQLADGYVAAAAVARVAVVNGEIAECGARISGYGPFNLTWNAGVVWFARRSRLLSGAAVRSGDAIVGLEETGCRSNGYSLLRHIVQRRHGDAWHTVACGDTTRGAGFATSADLHCRGRRYARWCAWRATSRPARCGARDRWRAAWEAWARVTTCGVGGRHHRSSAARPTAALSARAGQRQ